MSMQNRVARFVLVGIAMVLATTSLGVASAAGTRAAAVKRVVSARTTAAFSMPAPGTTTVQSVKLGAGAWTVMAKATAVNFSAPDFVRCDLYDRKHKVSLDGATYQLGSTIATAGSITNIATIVVPAAATVQVEQRCGHDSADGNSAYIDPDASLVAFQTLDGTAAGQSLTRTAAATPLTTTEATVATLALPVGDWAVSFKFTGVTFSGSTAISCALNAARGFDGGATTSVGATTAAATGGYSSYLSGAQTVTLGCRQTTGSGAYLDPGVVLWARKSKASTAVEGGCGAYLINAKSDLIALVRQGTQCTITGGDSTRMSNVAVTNGTWIAIGGESQIDNSSANADFVRCELTTDGAPLDGTAAWEATGGYVGVSLLGAAKLTQPASFHETCTRDTDNAKSTTSEGSLILIKV